MTFSRTTDSVVKQRTSPRQNTKTSEDEAKEHENSILMVFSSSSSSSIYCIQANAVTGENHSI
jgi:hypothetical protein